LQGGEIPTKNSAARVVEPASPGAYAAQCNKCAVKKREASRKLAAKKRTEREACRDGGDGRVLHSHLNTMFEQGEERGRSSE